MFSPVAGPSRIPDAPRPTKQPRRTEAHDVAGSTLAGMQPGPGLKALPDDVLLLIIGLIDVEDIIALRLSSKRFGPVTRLRWVWAEALTRHVLDKGLPVPAPVRDLKTLSSKELENRTRHATAFQRNWTSVQPAPKRTFEFAAGNDTAGVPEPVTHVRFLPGSDGRLVLAVQQSRVVCWEVPLGGEDAFVVAERSIPGATICDIRVNDDPTNPATVVIAWARRPPYHPPTSQVRETTIEAWHMDRFYGTFVTLRTDTLLENLRGRLLPLMRLCGDVALIGDPVAVWNWRIPGTYTMLNPHNIHASPVPDLLLAVKPVRDYLVIVRQSHLQLLPLPAFDNLGKPIARRRDAGAVYVHLPDVASEATIVVQPLPQIERQKWLFDPVTVVLKIQTDNGGVAMRTFDIAPRAVRPAVGEAPVCCAGCEADKARVLVQQLPFRPPTGPSITVPVSTSAGRLVGGIGGAGKGLWLETRTLRVKRESFCVRAFVGFDVGAMYSEEEGKWLFGFDVKRKPVFRARMGTGEVAQKKFRIQDVALEDTVGRVAVAGQDGRVCVMDYA
ncbi:hypothetical protein PENSPDRAFT_685812 [Peniophora sp. CONT]|nr:hypothetical protein PENSPDRAFT_685812 [Peniophora sp. CONT]